MMNELIEKIKNDKEINEIKKEWIKLNLQPWWGFNYDEYNSIDDYKQKLRIELEKMKKEKNISD